MTEQLAKLTVLLNRQLDVTRDDSLPIPRDGLACGDIQKLSYQVFDCGSEVDGGGYIGSISLLLLQ